MQFPEQSSQSSSEADAKEQQSAIQPFFEFSNAAPVHSSEPAPSSDKQVEPQLSEDEIRQGLVYPPPPSFYEGQQGTAIVMHPAPQPNISSQPAQPPAAPYPPPARPPSVPTPKTERKWIWIGLSVTSLILLLSCGLCGWALSQMGTLIAPTVKQAEESSQVVERYYAALEEKRYEDAYTYLAPQGALAGLTQEAFVKQAQEQTERSGEIVSYNLVSSSLRRGTETLTDPDWLSLTLEVKRTGLASPYAVHLTLEKINGQWKITHFDRL